MVIRNRAHRKIWGVLCFSVRSAKMYLMTPPISATFSRNGLIFNENILKVEKTGAHLQLQMIDNQHKFTVGGAQNLPPSVTNPSYMQSDQG